MNSSPSSASQDRSGGETTKWFHDHPLVIQYGVLGFIRACIVYIPRDDVRKLLEIAPRHIDEMRKQMSVPAAQETEPIDVLVAAVGCGRADLFDVLLCTDEDKNKWTQYGTSLNMCIVFSRATRLFGYANAISRFVLEEYATLHVAASPDANHATDVWAVDYDPQIIDVIAGAITAAGRTASSFATYLLSEAIVDSSSDAQCLERLKVLVKHGADLHANGNRQVPEGYRVADSRHAHLLARGYSKAAAYWKAQMDAQTNAAASASSVPTPDS
jgi:hypothetical protein